MSKNEEKIITLTLEEAKNVQECVHYCFDHTSETHFSFMNEKARFHLKLLVKRIGQAEKNHGT